MLNVLLLTSGNGSSPASDPFSLVLPIIFIVLIAAMWFFGGRSQRKQEKQQAEMRNNLQVGDEITTIGGIIGKVVSIKDETCVIETTRERTKIRILRTAISRVDVKAEDSID
ncbi:MAG: preprotein translocase subunit YajC [Ruminococcaceae bacterium]|nr:preprotein translocase subunit YajC [Oscillospiraceae bacterium]